MKRTGLLSIAIVLALGQAPGRAADPTQTVAFRGARILTVADGVIDSGVIIVRDGKIEGVGANLEIPDGAHVIDATDKTIAPGFIDAHCYVGLSCDALSEIDETVRPVTAEMQILDAFDPTADDVTSAARWGVTTALLAPGARNPIGGQAAVVKLCAGPQSRWLVKQAAGVKMSFADEAQMSDRRPTSLPGLVTLVKEYLDKAKTYTTNEFDPAGSVLNGLVRRSMPAYIYAQQVDELTAAIGTIDQYNLSAVLIGAHQADEIAEMLVERKIPVVCGPLLVYSKDKDLRRPGILAGAGVQIAFASFAPRTRVSDIRTSAILAVRYGLSRQEALKALTSNAAEMLGLANRLGSIRKGRDADLVVFDDDPLEMSSRVETVMINGKIVYRREGT